MKVNSNRYSLKWKNGVKRSKGTLFYTRPRNFLGETPLHTAVRHNAVRCVQLLLSDERTDPNIKYDNSESPLMFAVMFKRVACVELLLSDERTDLNIKDCDGNSPLMLAVKRNLVACVELLLADPRVDLMTRDNYERDEEEVTR